MTNSDSTVKNRNEIRREVINVRPTTTTREAIRITVAQREADNHELALATAIISGVVPVYVESPDFMEDLGKAYIAGAYFMRKFNKHVENGRKK